MSERSAPRVDRYRLGNALLDGEQAAEEVFLEHLSVLEQFGDRLRFSGTLARCTRCTRVLEISTG